MWKTTSAIVCGKSGTCLVATSRLMSSTHAMGSTKAPLPRSSSVRAWVIFNSLSSMHVRRFFAAQRTCAIGRQDRRCRRMHRFLRRAKSPCPQADNGNEGLCILSPREILFFEDAAVVEFVTGYGVGDGADTDFVFVG